MRGARAFFREYPQALILLLICLILGIGTMIAVAISTAQSNPTQSEQGLNISDGTVAPAPLF